MCEVVCLRVGYARRLFLWVSAIVFFLVREFEFELTMAARVLICLVWLLRAQK